MKQYIFLVWILLILGTGSSTAQNTLTSPVNLGSQDMDFIYTNTQNTENFTDEYSNRAFRTKDVFYRFDLMLPMDITISHCGSVLDATYIFLLDAKGNELTYSNSSPDNICKTSQAYLERTNLQPGTYYVVSEGYREDGYITTTISGTVKFPTSCIDAGKFSRDFTYTNTQNSANFTNSYLGLSTKDIFYKFELTGTADVIISHCGSAVDDTFLSLLDSGGALIEANSYYKDGCGNPNQAYLRKEKLPAGTYYIVSEGFFENGNITTNITGRFYMEVPYIDAGNVKAPFNFTHTQNTNEIHFDERGSSSDEVYYKIKVDEIVDMEITHEGSMLTDTYVYLFDEYGNSFYFLNENCTSFELISPSQMKIKELHPGTYFVMSEGNAENGIITTNIIAYMPIPSSCIDLGIKNSEFTYSDTQNSNNYTDSYQGRPTKDIFYKFTITEPMDITISHCGSEIPATYIYVLNAQASQIDYSNSSGSHVCSNTKQAYLEMIAMEPGSYYIVSEGADQNGNITTQITGKPTETQNIKIIVGQLNCNQTYRGLLDEVDLKAYPSDIVHHIQVNQKCFFKLIIQDEEKEYGELCAATFQAMVNSNTGNTWPVYLDRSTDAVRELVFIPEEGEYTVHTHIPINRRHHTRYIFEVDCEGLPGEENSATTTISYEYNIRSWLISIANPNFYQQIYYNKSNGSNTPVYNGNISAAEWYSRAEDKNTPNTYNYNYDQLSRLINAEYTDAQNRLYSTAYSYDKNGNILTLTRQGKTGSSGYGIIDQQIFTYNGNQPATGYTFNRNGDMTKDVSKGITDIQYNLLNLPQQIDIKSTVAEARNNYLYATTGAKLQVTQRWNPNYSTNPGSTTMNEALLTEEKVTDYIGNKIYENGELKKILVEGGYYDYQKGKYYFFVQDHLGNTRLVVNHEEGIVQQNDYYPFGMEFADNTGNHQPYKYNGKELDNTHGLNLYDYSARFYDPIIGRFTTMDPLAEKYYHTSPYAYCGNNPVNRIDPDGMDWYLYYNESENENKYAWSPEPTNQKQLDNVFGKGKTQYLGITHAEGDTYYGLMGGEWNLTTTDGKVMQKIEEAIMTFYDRVNKAESLNQDIYIPATDFDIGEYTSTTVLKSRSYSLHIFEAHGAQVVYPKLGPGSTNKSKYSPIERVRSTGKYKIRGIHHSGETISGPMMIFEKITLPEADPIVRGSAYLIFRSTASAEYYENTMSRLLYKR